MKRYNRSIVTGVLAVITAVANTSCNDFLDREPIDEIPASSFFTTSADFEAYIVSRFDENFDTFGGYTQSFTVDDAHTDDMVSGDVSYDIWAPGYRTLAETSDDSAWDFENLRKINYFLESAVAKYEAGEVTGTEDDIRHCIGEAYFLRAYDTFKRLTRIGDSPIITSTLPDDISTLREASIRVPRNEVAHFVLSDLDTALEYLSTSPTGGTVRITPNAAQLLKSRVALFEGTWLKYHNGTARVPGGLNWPGSTMYPDFSYTKGSIEAEYNYFFGVAMEAAEIVASSITLTANTGVMSPPYDATSLEGTGNDWNPYFEMFSAGDMSGYSEVLFWRQYVSALATSDKHCMATYRGNGGGYGMTRGLIESFPLEDGSTIDNPMTTYAGDLSLTAVKTDRDGRLQLFITDEDTIASLASSTYSRNYRVYGTPDILDSSKMPTGYNSRKYLSYDASYIQGASGLTNIYGCLIFRGVEAMLNYMEADYELNGSLDANSKQWWSDIRTRAKAGTYENTLSTLDLSEVAERDWAVYSNSTMVDETLYAIRMERRLELMAEGFRFKDLKRWASLSMVKDYVVEGFNLWGAYYAEYVSSTTGITQLVSEETGAGTSNVSSQKHSGDYLAPYRIVQDNNLVYWGYTWTTAYYLDPIETMHIKLAAESVDDLSTSTIYQNPGWGTTAGTTAEDY